MKIYKIAENRYLAIYKGQYLFGSSHTNALLKLMRAIMGQHYHFPEFQ